MHKSRGHPKKSEEEKKITRDAPQQRYQEKHATEINIRRAAARVIKSRASDHIDEQQSLTSFHEDRPIVQTAIPALNAETITTEEPTASMVKLDGVTRQLKQLDVERENLSLYYNHSLVSDHLSNHSNRYHR
jgi:hypothetical protein